MKKACGIQLALYLVIAAAIWLIVYRRYPVAFNATMSAVIGGFFVWVGVAYLWGIRAKLAEARMIRRARAGDPPVDGKKIAAIGRIVPTGSPLRSPFSDTPAVAWKYEIQAHGSESSSKIYSGFALNPSVIQGSRGVVRLLAYPDLQVKAEHVTSMEARKNAETYVASTTFRDPTAGTLRESFAELMALHKDDDGTIRHDQRYSGADSSDLGSCSFVEWIVRPGDQVCVIGLYSAQRGGIVHDPQNPLEQVKIVKGEPDAFAGRATRSAVRYFVGGTLILALALAGLAAFLAKVPLEAAEEIDPDLRVSWPEVRLERLIETRVRHPLREAGILSTPPRAEYHLADGLARGRVNDVILEHADGFRESQGTIIRLGRDEVVLTISESGELIALQLLGREIPRQAWPDALELELTTRTEDQVRGRMSFLSPDRSLPSARAAFAARVHDAPRP